MAQEAIIERILSDAKAEAEAIISDAEKRAAEVIAEANYRAQSAREETEKECAMRAAAISKGKEATARLDSNKILLGEKRRVIDTVYYRALQALLDLNEKDATALSERLLKAYAKEGDEIVFAPSYKYASAVEKLPVFQALKLKVSKEHAKIDGGFLLRGVLDDRDLSYGALLEADREERQTEIAAQLFKVN